MRTSGDQSLISRRAVLARATALGLSLWVIGPILEACGAVVRPSAAPTMTPSPTPTARPVITPVPSFGATPPVVTPSPVLADYGPMLVASAIAPVAVGSAALQTLLAEVAAEAGIPLDDGVVEGRRQARLTVVADDPLFIPQAYRLEVMPTADGPEVTLRTGGEAGAYLGLQSLGLLVARDGPTTWLRAGTLDDHPGFTARGAILDQYASPDAAASDESRARMLERLQFAARYKLNYVSIPPWPEAVRWCADHHVELMVAIGIHDKPTVTPVADLEAQVDAKLAAGIKSLAITTDENRVTDPDAIGRAHAERFAATIDYIRRRDPSVRITLLLPVYGGVPGKRLVNAPAGNGERYLAMIRDGVPSDVPTFWTGDAGVFSSTVTTAGAQKFSEAVGRDLFLWDNDAIRSSRERKPCSGRAADLDTVAHGYVGNLNSSEADWQGTNGDFALLTSLFYAWNPASYDSATAAASAERILATSRPTTG